MDNELLVKSIRELCKKNNVAVSQLENDLNFGAGLISRWVKSSPSVDKIVDIADYFHVTLDEVVGRKLIIEDDFIVALIEATESQNLVWHKYNENINAVKKYPGIFINPDEFVDYEQYTEYLNDHEGISYYASYKNGYISIYSFYEKFNITTPKELVLFIQPSINAELIPQKYNSKELLPLWLKVIYALGEESPDEIKAVELRNSFAHDRNSSTNKIDNNLKYINKAKIDEEQLTKIISKIDNPDIQNVFRVVTSKEFEKMMDQLDQIIERLKDVPV